ncbi:DNA primase family protein [Nocardioides piscis]|uniref:SF3 helicase domain-containing protein n=1 Tax=Nocardioides piscis TaxID=2714938 RepID=A0A6G7YBU3_9ACTN|nr:phage/plasmid primase, P4 family [Nocardioides piscis]QIK74108.1 hypothetical protein G7071_00300 [Nocardioides piscis]
MINLMRARHEATTDAVAAQIIAEDALRDRYCWTSGVGWLRYEHGVWTETSEATVIERIRRAVIDWRYIESSTGADAERQMRLKALLGRNRIAAIASLSRGIVQEETSAFDAHPDLLNVRNGVVDLRTGQLQPHDPSLLLTKIASCDYISGESHCDWTTALGSMPTGVAEWMQIRIGQASTGYMTSDDILPVLQGGGENGKTTVISAIERVLGTHARKVPDRVLLGNHNDHPTEMMTLRGVRFALIEETPEARHLNVKRLKDLLGTPTITARAIARDNVTWDATHSLFLTTNYAPRIDEVDHGTWRRLAMVRFPYTYVTTPQKDEERRGDPHLRDRLRDGLQGQHEAVLAWIVEGAVRWYSADRRIPTPPVQVFTDTRKWRGEADMVFAFVEECIEFDSDAMVTTTDLLAQFNDWLLQRGAHSWSDQTFSARFATHPTVAEHSVSKARTTKLDAITRRSGPLAFNKEPLTGRQSVWVGVRFERS